MQTDKKYFSSQGLGPELQSRCKLPLTDESRVFIFFISPSILAVIFSGRNSRDPLSLLLSRRQGFSQRERTESAETKLAALNEKIFNYSLSKSHLPPSMSALSSQPLFTNTFFRICTLLQAMLLEGECKQNNFVISCIFI